MFLTSEFIIHISTPGRRLCTTEKLIEDQTSMIVNILNNPSALVHNAGQTVITCNERELNDQLKGTLHFKVRESKGILSFKNNGQHRSNKRSIYS